MFRQASIPPPLDIAATRGPGGKPPAPVGVEAGAPYRRSLQFYLPTVFPIPGATEFFVDSFAASPGVGTITPAALQFTLPQASLGIIRVIGVGLDDMTQTTNVIWHFQVDGRNVPGWGAYRLFPGVAARVTSSADAWILLPPLAQIRVQIQNIDGAAYAVVGANYSGWYWPEALGKAWLGELFAREGDAPEQLLRPAYETR